MAPGPTQPMVHIDRGHLQAPSGTQLSASGFTLSLWVLMGPGLDGYTRIETGHFEAFLS